MAKLGLKPNSFVAVSAGKKSAAQKTAGVLRKLLGASVPGHMDQERYEFCWIVDFPMYEIGEESGQLEFCHNPFSMPQGGMQALEEKDPWRFMPISMTWCATAWSCPPGLSGTMCRRSWSRPFPGRPGRGGCKGQIPRHVQRLHLWRASPRRHCPRCGPHGHAPGRRRLHPGDHSLPHEQKRPGFDDGRSQSGGTEAAGGCAHSDQAVTGPKQVSAAHCSSKPAKFRFGGLVAA